MASDDGGDRREGAAARLFLRRRQRRTAARGRHVAAELEFYGFNDAAVEITSDDVFRDAWIGYLAQAVRPLFLNGNDPVTGLPAYGGAFLRQANVWGAVHEGCFRGEAGLQTERRDRWRSYETSLLANTELHKLSVCFMIGTPTIPSRLYALASWWLSYDPQWSVMAPIDPVPGGSAILPETELVPAYPLRTAHHSIDELREDTGVYVREFARCYLRGSPVGACAAFVNPSLRPMQMPHSASRYHRALVLDDRDLLRGGRVSWNHDVPTIIPASTGSSSSTAADAAHRRTRRTTWSVTSRAKHVRENYERPASTRQGAVRRGPMRHKADGN